MAASRFGGGGVSRKSACEMKWNPFTRKDMPDRLARSNRRVTGVSSELSPRLRAVLTLVAVIILLAGASWAGFWGFNRYYLHSENLFILKDIQRDVVINTKGKTLTPDLVRMMLNLENGTNLFWRSIVDCRAELQERAPNIKDVSITRCLPGRVIFSIVEREPIARVGKGTDGYVTDEDGVVFVRYRMDALPLIKGSDALAQVKPGDRLHGITLSAVKLVYNAMRPECRQRLLEVEIKKEEYFLLTMADYRQANFAWDGILDPERDSVAIMQNHFDQLGFFMESDAGRQSRFFDARIPKRITARLPTME